MYIYGIVHLYTVLVHSTPTSLHFALFFNLEFYEWGQIDQILDGQNTICIL